MWCITRIVSLNLDADGLRQGDDPLALLDGTPFMSCLQYGAFLRLQDAAVVQLACIKHEDLFVVDPLDEHVLLKGAVRERERLVVLDNRALVDLFHDKGLFEE